MSVTPLRFLEWEVRTKSPDMSSSTSFIVHLDNAHDCMNEFIETCLREDPDTTVTLSVSCRGVRGEPASDLAESEVGS